MAVLLELYTIIAFSLPHKWATHTATYSAHAIAMRTVKSSKPTAIESSLHDDRQMLCLSVFEDRQHTDFNMALSFGSNLPPLDHKVGHLDDSAWAGTGWDLHARFNVNYEG